MERPTATLSERPLPAPAAPASPPAAARRAPEGHFSSPRNFLNNRFAYAVISQRARGLSLGVNLNPDKLCNFACLYCEVNRDEPGLDAKVNVRVMTQELLSLLTRAFEHRMRELPAFRNTPDELLELKEVALSGNGEPTLCPNFSEIVREVVYLRSQGRFPFFKLVLITNATALDRPEVTEGLNLFSTHDEIWAKLDAGTQDYMDRINRPLVGLDQILDNILLVARRRPVIIQSLFPLVDGAEPPPEEIEAYVQRLATLKAAGAQIASVQVYSAHRPPHSPACDHLPLRSLSRIAHRIKEVTGLRAEVF
jgi:wyosine [tRNA(Phe)-imidazoG37] synthetase (radical SAM superfamily)